MKYVGKKQVLKAVKADLVKVVYIGKDAEEHVVSELKRICEEKGIELRLIETMEELGKIAEVEVPTSTAAE